MPVFICPSADSSVEHVGRQSAYHAGGMSVLLTEMYVLGGNLVPPTENEVALCPPKTYFH